MGFTNSPAEFQNCMAFILQEEIPDHANIFIDDLAIRGPASDYRQTDGTCETIPDNPGIRRFIWEHAQDVHRIMHRVKCAGGTFNPAKAQICAKKVVILGQTCGQEGRTPEDQKASKIQNWPIPVNTTQVRGFLGLCGTVRIWIPNYSKIARPLTELTKLGEEFIWDERRQAVFDQLKAFVASAPALTPIDYALDDPVVLSVDTSKIAVGFVLAQDRQEPDPKKPGQMKTVRRPARYGSLPMNKVESRYSQSKLELFGLYRALRHFRRYFIGVRKFVVEVDAKYIAGMINDPDILPNAPMNRWIQGILLFDFELRHVPAIRHKAPDAMSRKEPTLEDYVEEDDDWLDNIALALYKDTPDPNQPIEEYDQEAAVLTTHDPDLVEDISRQDRFLHYVIQFLTKFTYPPHVKTTQQQKRFIARATQYYIADDILWKRRKNLIPQKVILEQNQRYEILRNAHERAGHKGVEPVLAAIELRFYWPRMRTDVKHHVGSCHECQIRSTVKSHIPPTRSAPSTIWTKIYVDIMYMKEVDGYRYIVAARDDLTRVSEGRKLRSASAKNLARFFWEQIYCRYGMVGHVVTDNGPEVQSAFQVLLERMGIPQVKISSYNSQANGVVERGHFNIRESIVKACRGNLELWPHLVADAFFADRITVNRSTGFSPYYLLHGTHPVLPFDLSESTFLVQAFQKNLSTSDLLALRIRQLQKHPQDLRAAALALRKRRIQSNEAFEQRFRRRLRVKKFKPGQLVLLRNSSILTSHSRKHQPRYLGPFAIVKETTGGAYILQELDGAVARHRVAAARLIPYIARDKALLHRLDQDDTNHATSNSEASSDSEENSDPDDVTAVKKPWLFI